jgi:hypothetical protein
MGSPSPEAPPAAEDFWGERSAAIHDPVQTPDIEWPAVPPRRRSRLGRRHAIAAAAAAFAVVAASIVAAGGLGVSGPSHRLLGGSKVSVAAVLSSGVSRILNLGLPQIDVKATRPRPRVVVPARVRRVRRVSHPDLAVRRSAPVTAYRPVTTPVSTYHPPASVTHTDSSPTTDVHSSPVSKSASSSAPVKPTGEAGALGPIQSPNG